MMTRQKRGEVTALPVNMRDLINRTAAESTRIEFQADWNPEPILHVFRASRKVFPVRAARVWIWKRSMTRRKQNGARPTGGRPRGEMIKP